MITPKELFDSSTKTKTVISIDYNDLDEIITLHFHPESWPKKQYECIAYQEWANNQSHTFNLTKIGEIHSWNIKNVENAYKGDWSNTSLYAMLEELVKKEVIPSCELLVDVSW